MSIAFLITSPYQVYHYKWLAPHFDDPTAVIEVRDREYGQLDEFVERHLPNCERQWVSKSQLATLDGRYQAVVCQTPVLPLEFFTKTLVVAQQYSLAKEQYQYGVWRAHAHLNLMYGNYSVSMVSGFSNAVATGNPLLDPYFQQQRPPRSADSGRRRRLLYMPTYGQLSSLPIVMPRLRGVDADITLKVHHAGDTELPGRRPDGLRVVYSDADPVELFRTHDGVISDVSGAAYDALYAGLPVVIAASSYGSDQDYERMSSEEREHSLLANVAAVWNVKRDLFEAFSTAEARLGSSAYDDFVERMFVNAGSAGAACAGEIRRLLTNGEPAHFGAQQVRAATRRYISMGRRHRNLYVDEETGDLRIEHEVRPSWVEQRLMAPRLAYRRFRRLLAGSATLRRLVQAARREVRARLDAAARSVEGPPPAPSPAARREEMFRALLPHMEHHGASVVRDCDSTGADAAVLVGAKRGLYHALRGLAAERQDVVVRVGTDWRIVETLPLNRLRSYDLFNAHWLEIGSVLERGSYRIGVDGYLTMLMVEHDQAKNRYLALKVRARRTDWTDLFTQADASLTVRGTLAVGVRAAHPAAPVDAVYTWVDSRDPTWRKAHARYSGDQGIHIPSANNEERYADREELRHSLRALWMFAPFIRHVYVVTADQQPSWLVEDPRVTIVPHREIFPDPAVLPTFNSHAIEACLHRIPGLSEHFLYFNDDVFVGREVSEADFFTTAGLAKVRLSPSQYIYQGKPESTAIPTDWAGHNVVSLMQRDFGMTFDRRVQHVPLVQRRSLLEEIEKKYPEELERTRAARFRSITDVALPSMLGQFYGIATGRAVEWPNARNEYIYLDTGRHDSFDRYSQILRIRPRFFCLNATRHEDVSLADQAKHLSDFLASAFPYSAPWEREMPIRQRRDLAPQPAHGQ